MYGKYLYKRAIHLVRQNNLHPKIEFVDLKNIEAGSKKMKKSVFFFKEGKQTTRLTEKIIRTYKLYEFYFFAMREYCC